MDYAEYERVFNTGDDDLLVERFFCDDVTFSAGSGDREGKDGLLAFLRWAHDGVREVMRPQSWVLQGDHLFAEVDMDFHASKERPDFPFGHLHPGDTVTVKFLVHYTLRDGKVAALKSMTWAPGKGVTTLPLLGPHPSQLAAYGAYTAAFSNGDPGRYTRFYTDDVELLLGSVAPMKGKQAIADFYTAMFQRVREGLTVHSITASEHEIVSDTTSRFTAIADAPDFVVGPLGKGDYIEVRVIVTYTLRDGLIERIAVQRAGEPVTVRA
ncbi:MAG: nuclear transport factor 2 family protein [Porphyrobacter sp.]|nr:nuclear transport factor 2 family protein [Porphyrobacter sp.]